ncbi:hypothetical protein L1887_36254 [Cichorium endivia]|nr:hypothetical protein L1887_36254 [Cichorium endivia]
MTMKLTDGFRNYRFSDSTLLNKALRLREPASVASRSIIELHGINHAISVKQMVAGGRFEQLITNPEYLDYIKNPIDEEMKPEVHSEFLIGLEIPIFWIKQEKEIKIEAQIEIKQEDSNSTFEVELYLVPGYLSIVLKIAHFLACV